MIRTALLVAPHLLMDSRHWPLLERIAGMIVRRAEGRLNTSILEVPAHCMCGVAGNEREDEAARRSVLDGEDAVHGDDEVEAGRRYTET